MFTTLTFSQNLTQIISGTIVYVDSKLKLPGTTLIMYRVYF
jgi:hypothetical protein